MVMLTLLLLVLVVGALVDVLRAPAASIKRGRRGVWAAVVVLLPVIGGALWFAFGRRRGTLYSDDAVDEDEALDPGGDDSGLGDLPVGPPATDMGVLDPGSPESATTHAAPGGATDGWTTPARKSTEQQLAELEEEIAFWEARTRLTDGSDGDRLRERGRSD